MYFLISTRRGGVGRQETLSVLFVFELSLRSGRLGSSRSLRYDRVFLNVLLFFFKTLFHRCDRVSLKFSLSYFKTSFHRNPPSTVSHVSFRADDDSPVPGDPRPLARDLSSVTCVYSVYSTFSSTGPDSRQWGPTPLIPTTDNRKVHIEIQFFGN